MTRVVFGFILLVCTLGVARATHNRMGDITYRHLYGNTYEVWVKTCTKLSAEADRPELVISYGDGALDTIPRISELFYPMTDTKENLYRGVHTFPGPGIYRIRMEDPNRNSGVLNIANSVEKVFCIQSELIVSPFIGLPNNSPVFLECPCPEVACLNRRWIYNPSVYDPDGDSLSFALIPCKGEGCIDFAMPQVFQYPQQVGGGTMTIDPLTGTLIWESPGIIGEYNLAILITEFRNGVKVGSVIRDMQVTVAPCNNEPPVMEPVDALCIAAGSLFQQIVTASDVNDTQVLTFSAYGESFQLPSSPSAFSFVPSVSPASGMLNWTPDCAAARPQPYQVVVEVSDNAQDVALKDILTLQLTVDAPPVSNLTVTPVGTQLNLTWDAHPCENVTYKIYSSPDGGSLPSACCHSNVPSAFGFVEIGQTTDTFFTDNSELVIGNQYCYTVTAVLPNGTESCPASAECSQLAFEVPILTHVSIVATDAASGTDTVRWMHPLELNQAVFGGPYVYRLYRATGTDFPQLLVYESPAQNFLTDLDTVFADSGLNTVELEYRYRIELISNGVAVGSGASSSSVYLSLTPNDNELLLSWTLNQSWMVDSTQIFRESPTGSGNFVSIGWTYGSTYRDTGLVNLQTYCYRVQTYGHYSLQDVPRPLINWSQEVCGVPFDNTPPCPPMLSITADCEEGSNVLHWTNPNFTCADDVTRYRIYFAPQHNQELEFLAEIVGAQDTSFVHFLPAGTAGCYVVTAVDSIPYNNESAPSNLICVSHCPPLYQLPNVITPNGDGNNDVFHPLLPYKYVSRVDLTVMNRWGNVLFETNDPFIGWDGKDQKTGRPVVDGVYFYLCRVYFVTLSGEQIMDLHGFVHVFNGK
jgi:gliding motility-associated-like protein